MRISIFAVGRLGRGPEMELVNDYLERATATGRALALGPVELTELVARKQGRQAEAETLLGAVDAQVPTGLHVIACDERGPAPGSRAFAAQLGALRDRGLRRLVLLIGGADGLWPTVLQRADEQLSFGPQTWPHALARVMLAEQLYRATTILADGPYHRD